jgi:hypothetical protein
VGLANGWGATNDPGRTVGGRPSPACAARSSVDSLRSNSAMAASMVISNEGFADPLFEIAPEDMIEAATRAESKDNT